MTARYGLAAYLFTNDMNRILRAVRDMEVRRALYQSRSGGIDPRIPHGLEAEWHWWRRRQVRSRTISAKKNGLHSIPRLIRDTMQSHPRVALWNVLATLSAVVPGGRGQAHCGQIRASGS